MTRTYIGLFTVTVLFFFGAESSLDNFYREDVELRTGKIYNGRSASPTRHRWSAWLYDENKNKMVCGGSLVDEFWIMTTASCASKAFNNVVVGDFNMYKPDGEQCIPVDHVVIHPNFNASTYANDIALVKLRYAVDLKDGHAEVIRRMATARLENTKPAICLISGWGLTLADGWQWPTAASLQELRLERLNDTECESQGLEIPQSSFCFKSVRHHASPCMRDEGSPIVCKYVNNKWNLVGMYSFARQGDGCKFGPKGATKICALRSWIKETMSMG